MNMIDKKIEEAAKAICFDDKMTYDSYCKIEGFRKGVEWAINEFLKDICHSPEEKPRNLDYIVFIADVFGEDYLFTKQVDNTKDWKAEVEAHGIEQWAYRDDIVSLIFKNNHANS